MNYEKLTIDSIYSQEEGGFNYSLPVGILKGMLSGRAFDHKNEYTSEESENLDQDIAEIFGAIMDEHPIHEKTMILTAGGPGAGKTTLLEQHRARQIQEKRVLAYSDPDAVCLKQQRRTYQAELAKICRPPSRRSELINTRNGVRDPMLPII